MSQIVCRGAAICSAVVLILGVLFVSAPAAAASRNGREREARKACLNGDFATGVRILSDLFVETLDATYIFNQGRCFEQNRRYEDALGRFDEFLRAAGKLRAEDRTRAEEHILDCKRRLAEERANSMTPPTPTPTPTPQPLVVLAPTAASTSQGPGTTAQSPEVSTSAVGSPRAPSPRRWGLLTAGIATGAVGVAGIVTGVVLNLKANAMVNDMENQLGAYSSDKENSQKNYRTVAWVGYGVGVGCAVAGAILIGLGLQSGARSPTDVALLPTAGPGHVGAALTGGF